jgi:hypothetical protein
MFVLIQRKLRTSRLGLKFLTDPYLPGVLKYVFEVTGSGISSISNESLYLGNITWLLAQINE